MDRGFLPIEKSETFGEGALATGIGFAMRGIQSFE